jgi:hypothetical protein
LIGILTILFFFFTLPAKKLVNLPELTKPHFLRVVGKKVYIIDEKTYTLFVYSLSPFKLIFSFGKKGDGPRDFKYLPFVYIQKDTLSCTDFTKTIMLSPKGKIQKIKNYTDFKDFSLNSEMLLIPAGENHLRITADHKEEKRHIWLLDQNYLRIKKLYGGPFCWKMEDGRKYRTDTVVNLGKIFISDSQRGFYIKVFDLTGKELYTIDKGDKISQAPVTKQDKMQSFENLKEYQPKLTYELFEKMVKFPKYHPLLHHFQVADNKIYATTYSKRGDLRELVILDLSGKILKRMFLPFPSIKPLRGSLRFDMFNIDQETLYELLFNPITNKWELHRTLLK